MKIYVAGSSHLTHYTIVGAAFRGLHVTDEASEADLILIAHDTPTTKDGIRDLSIVELLVINYCGMKKPVLLMSQVPPGFCRKQNMPNLYHYPETLRIKDSYERACSPEYIIIGMQRDGYGVHNEVIDYACAFSSHIEWTNYETAEMCKIAVNTYLAMQVDFANRMKSACDKVNADWGMIADVIKLDKRIGPHAYLTPGRWQDSLHLLRDSVTLKEIEDAR